MSVLGPAVLAAVLVTAGCAQVVDGKAEGGAPVVPHSSSPTGPTGFPSTTSAPPTSSTPTDPPSTTSIAPPTAPSTSAPARTLLQLVEPAPPGSTAGRTAWDRLATPTVDQFVHEYYDKTDWASESKLLKGEGLQKVAHRVWTSSDLVYGDMILLQYGDNSGALTRFIGVTNATRRESGQQEVAIGGRGTPVTFVTTKKDSLGNTIVATYAEVGKIVVELHTFNKGTWNRADVTSWITKQISLLP